MKVSYVIKLLLAAALALATGPSARAGIHEWTGAVNGYWSNTNNWAGGSAPAVFETPPVEVDFPSGVSRTNTINDIGEIYLGHYEPLVVDSFIVGGNNYVFSGTGLGRTIVMSGNPVSFFDISLANFQCLGTNITFGPSLYLNLNNTNTITNSAGSTLFFQSLISGSGGLTFFGQGSLAFESDTNIFGGETNNTFTGTFEVQSGTVYLDNFAFVEFEFAPFIGEVDAISIGGSLIVGTTNPAVPANVYVQRVDQFTTDCDVTINQGGALHIERTLEQDADDLGPDPGSEMAIRSLTLNGGLLDVGQFVWNDGYGHFSANDCELDIASNCVSDPFPSPTTPQIVGSGVIFFYGETFNVANDLLLVNCFASGLVKSGPGSLLLVGSNEIDGLVVAQGAAYAESPNLTMDYLTVSNGAQMNIDANCKLEGQLDFSGFGVNGSGAALNIQSASFTAFIERVTVSGETAIDIVNPTDQLNLLASDRQTYVAGTNNLYKTGAGTLGFEGFVPNIPNFGATNLPVPISNLFSGTLYIQGGSVELNSGVTNGSYPNAAGIALNGPIVIGTNNSTIPCYLILDTNQQLNADVAITINDGCALELVGGSSQSVGSLTLNGGGVDFGTVVLNGNLTAQNGVHAPAFFFADLNLTASNQVITVAANSTLSILGEVSDGGNPLGLTKAGLGELALLIEDDYEGVTTVNAGRLSVQDDMALGFSTSIIVSAGAEIDLGDQINVGLQALNIAGGGVDGQGAFKGSGTNSWAGPITLSGATTFDVAANSLTLLSGVISGGSSDSLLKNGTGGLEFNGNTANTYTGTTIVQQGTLSLSRTNATALHGPLVIGNNVDGPNAETVFLLQNAQVTNYPLTINPSGLLNVGNGSYVTASVGALSGSGAIQIPEGSLGVGNDNSSSVFAGSISGNGAFDKNGGGTLTLTGNGSLSGTVYIVEGQLLVNGSLASATMNVYPLAVLGGVGTVGPIIGSGVVNPGTGGPGLLNSGTAGFQSSGSFLVNLNGTSPGSGYTQLDVTGFVNLTNPALQVSMGIKGAPNNQYTIINNEAFAAINGTFAGLPEGATVTATNGVRFTISYQGGTGNDVVLTQLGLPAPPKFTGIIKLGNGNTTLNGTGTANTTYQVEANTNLATTNWVLLGTVTAGNSGGLSFTDLESTNYPSRFYRLTLP
jgi:autotransporter-associated beta strand protein